MSHRRIIERITERLRHTSRPRGVGAGRGAAGLVKPVEGGGRNPENRETLRPSRVMDACRRRFARLHGVITGQP